MEEGRKSGGEEGRSFPIDEDGGSQARGREETQTLRKSNDALKPSCTRENTKISEIRLIRDREKTNPRLLPPSPHAIVPLL